MINPWKHEWKFSDEQYATSKALGIRPAYYQHGRGGLGSSYRSSMFNGDYQYQTSPYGLFHHQTQPPHINYRFNRESKRAMQIRNSLLSEKIKSQSLTRTNQNVTGMVYANRNVNSMSFFGDLDQISVETVLSTTELVGYFEQKLKKYTKISKDEDNFDKESRQAKAEIEKPEEIIEEDATFQNRFTGKTPIQILTEAKESSDISKALVKFLQMKKGEELEQFAKVVNSDLQNYVENENTCYLVKTLVKISDSTMKKAYNLSVHRFDEMLHKVHTCRLVYTMCNHSERFRDLLQINFKTRMLKLLSSLSGANLLSLLICNSKDLNKFDFIIEELQRTPEVIKNPFFSRAFATYMNKCSMESLDMISMMLSKNLPFLLQDNFGNYLLQIFYERDSKQGVEMCNAALKKLYKKVFIRRYSRYVLLKALQHKAGPQLAEDLLYLALKDSYTLQNVLLKGFSQELLLLTFGKVPSKTSLLHLVEMLSKWNPSRNLVSEDNESMYQTLLRDLAILRKYALSE